MHDLASRDCVPCKGGTPPLTGVEQQRFLQALDSQWRIVNGHHLEREFRFADFRAGLEFTNRVGALAEAQSHHPDIALAWGKVKLTLWTHTIDGLSESDFVFAAKVDRLPVA